MRREVAKNWVVERLRAMLAAVPLTTRTKVLFVGPKKITEQLANVHPDVSVGWFNAIVGRDEWRGTPTMVLAGRNLPRPDAVEAVAEALTGWELRSKRHGEFYPLRDSPIYVRQPDRSIATRITQTHGHPDPIAEAVRRRKCEGEVAQAMGRPRGLLATADDPVLIIVLGDVPHEFPVDAFVSSDEILNPPAWARMYGDGGVILTRPEHMIRAYKKHWRTTDTARKALARDRTMAHWPFGVSSRRQNGKIPYKSLSTEIDQFVAVSGLVRINYRLASESTSVTASFNPNISDPRGWLEQALGPVSEFEIVDQSPRSMVIIQPGQRGSVAAYARLHGLTPKVTQKRLQRDPKGNKEWHSQWDQNAGWPQFRVRLGRYPLDARVSPHANAKVVLGALGFEIVEPKTPLLKNPPLNRPRRLLASAGGGQQVVAATIRLRRAGSLLFKMSRRCGAQPRRSRSSYAGVSQ